MRCLIFQWALWSFGALQYYKKKINSSHSNGHVSIDTYFFLEADSFTNIACVFELETAVTVQLGYCSHIQNEVAPQPQPKSMTDIPSLTRARSHTSCNIASSAWSMLHVSFGNKHELYLRRFPRTISKNFVGT